MFLVTAVGWAVTFIISLAFFLLNFENKMLLLEETCESGGLEGMLSMLQTPIKSATSYYGAIRERTRDLYFTVINHDIFQSELIQNGKFVVIQALNYSIEFVDLYQNLDIVYKRMLLSIAFSCSVLYVFLNWVDISEGRARSSQPIGEFNQDVLPVAHHHHLAGELSGVQVTAVTSVYNKVFRSLEESNFFTKQQHDMATYAITGTLQLTDVLTMLDPLFAALHEGVENLAILSQEYMKQNAQLVAAEEAFRTGEVNTAGAQNEEELMTSLSRKDAEIAELTGEIENLIQDIEHFIDETTQIHSERGNLSAQLEKQKSKADKATQQYNVVMKEAEDSQHSIEDELKAEKDLNEAVIKDYSRNLQTVLKILLQLSGSGEPAFVSIEDFLLSDTFGDYLKLGDYPAELEADKLFQDSTDRADTYSQHLRILKRKY